MIVENFQARAEQEFYDSRRPTCYYLTLTQVDKNLPVTMELAASKLSNSRYGLHMFLPLKVHSMSVREVGEIQAEFMLMIELKKEGHHCLFNRHKR